jgi:hypothetical protein
MPDPFKPGDRVRLTDEAAGHFPGHPRLYRDAMVGTKGRVYALVAVRLAPQRAACRPTKPRPHRPRIWHVHACWLEPAP